MCKKIVTPHPPVKEPSEYRGRNPKVNLASGEDRTNAETHPIEG